MEGGDECGLKLAFDDWKAGDMVECFAVSEERKKIGAPLFELDPSLEENLFKFDRKDGGDGMTLEMDSVYFSENDFEEAGNSFLVKEPETPVSGNNAPRVKMTKKKGRVIYEEV